MLPPCGHEFCERDRCFDPWYGITKSTCTDIELVPADRCPQCGSAVHFHGFGQQPLFWMYGAGAVESRSVRVCAGGCGWTLTAAEDTTNPRT